MIFVSFLYFFYVSVLNTFTFFARHVHQGRLGIQFTNEDFTILIQGDPHGALELKQSIENYVPQKRSISDRTPLASQTPSVSIPPSKRKILPNPIASPSVSSILKYFVSRPKSIGIESPTSLLTKESNQLTTNHQLPSKSTSPNIPSNLSRNTENKNKINEAPVAAQSLPKSSIIHAFMRGKQHQKNITTSVTNPVAEISPEQRRFNEKKASHDIKTFQDEHPQKNDLEQFNSNVFDDDDEEEFQFLNKVRRCNPTIRSRNNNKPHVGNYLEIPAPVSPSMHFMNTSIGHDETSPINSNARRRRSSAAEPVYPDADDRIDSTAIKSDLRTNVKTEDYSANSKDTQKGTDIYFPLSPTTPSHLVSVPFAVSTEKWNCPSPSLMQVRQGDEGEVRSLAAQTCSDVEMQSKLHPSTYMAFKAHNAVPAVSKNLFGTPSQCDPQKEYSQGATSCANSASVMRRHRRLSSDGILILEEGEEVPLKVKSPVKKPLEAPVIHQFATSSLQVRSTQLDSLFKAPPPPSMTTSNIPSIQKLMSSQPSCTYPTREFMSPSTFQPCTPVSVSTQSVSVRSVSSRAVSPSLPSPSPSGADMFRKFLSARSRTVNDVIREQDAKCSPFNKILLSNAKPIQMRPALTPVPKSCDPSEPAAHSANDRSSHASSQRSQSCSRSVEIQRHHTFNQLSTSPSQNYTSRPASLVGKSLLSGSGACNNSIQSKASSVNSAGLPNKSPPSSTQSSPHAMGRSHAIDLGAPPTQVGDAAHPARRAVSPSHSTPASPQPLIDPLHNLLLHDSHLSASQQEVVRQVQKGHSVFITGGAGVGKSYLSKILVGALSQRYGSESVAITASTGVAACLLGGTTLHRYAHLGSTDFSNDREVRTMVSRAVRRPEVTTRIRQTRVLFVDEISMIDGYLLDAVDTTLRAIRGNQLPFGGIQVLLVGDFLQLPPVWRDTQMNTLSNGSGNNASRNEGLFAFESAVWRRLFSSANQKGVCIELKEVFRQCGEDERAFIDALNEIRVGACSDTTANLLQSRMGTRITFSGNNNQNANRSVLRLLPLRRQADDINMRALKSLPGVSIFFKAEDSVHEAGMNLNHLTPARDVLELKVGAAVILIKNLAVDQGLVNGARGIIIRIDSEAVGSKMVRAPTVRFENGLEKVIAPETWNVSSVTANSDLSHSASNFSSQSPVSSRIQIPLELAWAISIHKSQGMTLEHAEIWLGGVFEAGQAYVALSRLKSLKGLNLQGMRNSQAIKDSVKAHPKCINFYKTL